MYESKEYRAIRKKIVKARQRVEDLETESGRILSSQQMKCVCGKVHAIRDVVYIDVIHYHKSYAAYEDSTWDAAEHYAHAVAPCCEKTLYIDDPGLLKLKDSFGMRTRYYGPKAETPRPYFEVGYKFSRDQQKLPDVKSLLNHFKKIQKADK